MGAQTTQQPVRWLTAGRTVSPSLAVLGALIVGGLAVESLADIAERMKQTSFGADLTSYYAMARQRAWGQLSLGITGGVFGVLMAFTPTVRWLWAAGLGVVGLILVVRYGIVLNALPFLAAAALAFVHNDRRLHPVEAER